MSRVYLGNLSYDTGEREIEKFFKGYGRVGSICVKEGFGFAEFEDKRDADDAVKDLDGTDLDGRRIRVEHTKGNRFDGGGGGGRGRSRSRSRGSPGRGSGAGRGRPPGARTGYRVVVENLSSSTSWQDLKDFMRTAGEVTYTSVDNRTRQGEGLAEFGSRSDMEYALDKLDGAELGGRRIKLFEEGKTRDRSRSRSRSPRRRSRSRSKDRKRSRKDSRSKSRSKSRSRSGKRKDSRSKSRSRSKRKESRSKSDRKSKSGDRKDSRSKSRSGSSRKDKSRSRS